MKEKEKDIENSIIEYLEIKKIFAWKNETQATYDPKRKAYRKNNTKKTGVSDILGIYRTKFLAIEVKTKDGMQDVKRAIKRNLKGLPLNKQYNHLIEQYEFIKDVRKNGGIAFFSRSLRHVSKTLKKHC